MVYSPGEGVARPPGGVACPPVEGVACPPGEGVACLNDHLLRTLEYEAGR